MKTKTQTKFDNIIKKAFHERLKPLGFKKKAYSFYLPLDVLGHIINIQKSQWGSKDQISFTINIGVFLPEYWLAVYNHSNTHIPDFPTESACLIRNRIGGLINSKDKWYELNENTDENYLIREMIKNLESYIFPYFKKMDTIQKLIYFLDNNKINSGTPLAKLITYAEYGELDKARSEYLALIHDKSFNFHFREKVKKLGNKYKLN